MYEPTYLVPQRLLFDVQAKGDVVRVLGHRLTDAIRDGLAAEIIARRRHRFDSASQAYTCAIVNALDAGATPGELTGYGVSRDLAAELERRAWR
jgi:hypothetical protein